MSIKSAVCFVLIFVLILSVFSLSAFAEELTPFSEVPVLQSGSTFGSYGLYLGYKNPPGTSGDIYCASDVSDTYAFRTSGNIVFAGSSQFVVYFGASLSSSAVGYTNILNQYDTLYYSIPAYGTVSYYQSVNSSIPVFSTVEEGLDALIDYLDGGSSSTSSSFQYSLPPGNVAYIEMGSSSAIKLAMDFPELSNSFGTPFSKANSAYRLVDSLPTLGSSVSSGTIIPWNKSGRLNLIGQTTEASFGPIGPIATRYVAIINPSYYDHVLVTGTYRQNPPIQIDALNVLSIQVYPLRSDFTFNNDTGEVSTTIAGDAYTGDVDSESGEIYWTDPSGGTAAPPLGGNNLPEAGNSIFDTLRNIASDFSEFLKGPVSAIRVVVQSIRDFMGSFTQLYTWLPSPVYNLITSALMIALTIGVIKIFV